VRPVARRAAGVRGWPTLNGGRVARIGIECRRQRGTHPPHICPLIDVRTAWPRLQRARAAGARVAAAGRGPARHDV